MRIDRTDSEGSGTGRSGTGIIRSREMLRHLQCLQEEYTNFVNRACVGASLFVVAWFIYLGIIHLPVL